MKKQKVFALALAGITTLGALAAGTPVMASAAPGLSSGTQEAENGQSGETSVNLTVKAVQGTYLLKVPSTTALDKDGKAVALDGGITVSGENMKNSVVVTATSQNGWALQSENGERFSYYGLFQDEAGTKLFENMTFTAEEVNAGDGHGTTKDVYAKIEGTNEDAKAGTYSDVITFKAEATGTSGGGETPDATEKSYQELTLDELTELYKKASASGESYITYDTDDNAKKWGDEQQKKLEDNGDDRYVIVIRGFDADLGFETYDSSMEYWPTWSYDLLCEKYKNNRCVIYLYK